MAQVSTESLKDSLSHLESDVIYDDVLEGNDSDITLDGGSQELLPSINNDFIPRRSHNLRLKHSFPAGFATMMQAKDVPVIKRDDMDAFDLSRSIASVGPEVKKGKLPPDFSFTQWTKGGEAGGLESPEKVDSYAGVAGQFRRVPSAQGERPRSRGAAVQEIQLGVDNRHLMRYKNPVLANVNATDEEDFEDIDRLVETLETDLGRVSVSHASGDHESVQETLSMASIISEAQFVPRARIKLPDYSFTELTAEVINLRAYIESAYLQASSRRMGEDLESDNQSYVASQPPIGQPDEIRVALKLNFVQFKRSIVEMLRAKYRMHEATTQNMQVSYFDIDTQHWRDVSKPLQWEQAKLKARSSDGIVRVGFSILDAPAQDSVAPPGSGQGERSMGATSSPVKFNANTLDAGISEAESERSKLEAFIRVPSKNKQNVYRPSVRLAQRSFQLPSTTMLRSTQKGKGGKLPKLEEANKIEEMRRVMTMAKSLENKLYRTRW